MSAGVEVSPSQNKPLLSVWRRERLLDGKIVEEVISENENLVETILEVENSAETIPGERNLADAIGEDENSTETIPGQQNSAEAITEDESSVGKITEAEYSSETISEEENLVEAIPRRRKSKKRVNKVNNDDPKPRKGRQKSINICPHNGCGKVFKKPSRLLWHTRLHTGEKPYACPWENCTKAYRTTSHLRRHEETHNPVEERLICRHCRLTFKNRQNLIKHCRRLHENNNRLSCEECGKVFRKKKNLQFHLESHQDMKYNCDKCQKVFDNGLKYRRHMSIIHVLKYSCSFNDCNAKFEKFLEYKAHCRDHEEPNEDNKCGLQRKIKRRSRLVTCPYENCSRIYYYQSNLNHHIRSFHQGIRKYECDLCSKNYPLKRPLIFHMQKVHNIDRSSKEDDEVQVEEMRFCQIKIEEFKIEAVEDVKKKRKRRSDAGKPRKAPVVKETEVE